MLLETSIEDVLLVVSWYRMSQWLVAKSQLQYQYRKVPLFCKTCHYTLF